MKSEGRRISTFQPTLRPLGSEAFFHLIESTRMSESNDTLAFLGLLLVDRNAFNSSI